MSWSFLGGSEVGKGKFIGPGSWWVLGYGGQLSRDSYRCVVGTDTKPAPGGVLITQAKSLSLNPKATEHWRPFIQRRFAND